MVYHVPGQAAADKKAKIELLRKHFKASWTEMEEVMPLLDLRAGYDSLYQELEGAPSRYSVSVKPAPTGPIDELPAHSAAPTNGATKQTPIPVPGKADEAGSDWVSWGGRFIADALKVKTVAELAALLATNESPLRNMENEAADTYEHVRASVFAINTQIANREAGKVAA
jgi:hypothetical protein